MEYRTGVEVIRNAITEHLPSELIIAREQNPLARYT